MCWQGYCSWKKPLWCEMYFSVKKVVTASWQINSFPSVFSAPHLPPMFLGWLGFFLFWVFQHLFPKRTNSCLQMFWKSVFWEVAKKACLETFQARYIFLCCSASLLCILFNICEVLGKWFLHQCRPSLVYFVLLTTWSTICTSKVFISREGFGSRLA